jgi:hypothetical protein
VSDDRLIDLVRQVAAAYASGVAEGRRQAEADLEAARLRVLELEVALARRVRCAS